MAHTDKQTPLVQLQAANKRTYGLEYPPEHEIPFAPCGIPSFKTRTDTQAVQKTINLMERFSVPHVRLYRYCYPRQPEHIATLELGYFKPTESYRPDNRL